MTTHTATLDEVITLMKIYYGWNEKITYIMETGQCPSRYGLHPVHAPASMTRGWKLIAPAVDAAAVEWGLSVHEAFDVLVGNLPAVGGESERMHFLGLCAAAIA